MALNGVGYILGGVASSQGCLTGDIVGSLGLGRVDLAAEYEFTKGLSVDSLVSSLPARKRLQGVRQQG